MDKDRGKIVLNGFNLEPAERAIVDNTISNYIHKIRERVDYEEFRLRLKQRQYGKTFLHEVEGNIRIGSNIMTAKVTGYNLFAVLADVLEKLLNEAVHKTRTRRQ